MVSGLMNKIGNYSSWNNFRLFSPQRKDTHHALLTGDIGCRKIQSIPQDDYLMMDNFTYEI